MIDCYVKSAYAKTNVQNAETNNTTPFSPSTKVAAWFFVFVLVFL